jgi:hypothetical protein
MTTPARSLLSAGLSAAVSLMLALAGARPAVAQATVPYPPPGYAAEWQPEPAPYPDPIEYQDGEALDPARPAAARAAHGPGFYLRLTLGPTLSHVSSHANGFTNSITGMGGALSLAAGGFLVDNLAAFAELSGASALNPDFRGADVVPERTALTTLAVGGGLVYYFMPANLSLSGAMLLTQARAVDRTVGGGTLLGRTNFGPGLHVAAGKEWVLTGNFGLGLSLRGHLAWLKDASPAAASGPAAPWRSYGLSLALSASFG